MSNEKVMLRAKRLVAVLPQYVKSDMENIVTLVGEQQAQITAQAETILQQREQLQLVRNRNTELTNALEAIGYMTPTAESASRQRINTMAATLQETI